MKKKFAFLLMGKEFDTAKDTAVFETEHMISYIFTVTSFEEALKRAVACAEDGVGAIEVCGAFGKEWADKIIAATGNKVAVGYVVHNPEQAVLRQGMIAAHDKARLPSEDGLPFYGRDGVTPSKPPIYRFRFRLPGS